MNAKDYNSDLPHSMPREGFILALCYGLAEPWQKEHFEVNHDAPIAPAGILNEHGLELLSYAIEDGWDHHSFFYYKRLGVNWFTDDAIESLITFCNPQLSRNPNISQIISDTYLLDVPKENDYPDYKDHDKIRLLGGGGAKSVPMVIRPWTLWDFQLTDQNYFRVGYITDQNNGSPVEINNPEFDYGKTDLSNFPDPNASFVSRVRLLLESISYLSASSLNTSLCEAINMKALTDEFNTLLCDHGPFIGAWYDNIIWPKAMRVIANKLRSEDLSVLCSDAFGSYKYSHRVTYDRVKRHLFWQLLGYSLNDLMVCKKVNMWMERYYSNRICDICNTDFNILTISSDDYFGSGGSKNICLDCPIMEFPNITELADKVCAFVEACVIPPPDGKTPVDARVTSNMEYPQIVNMIRAWAKMGGIQYVKNLCRLSWFEIMAQSGALPDGTLVTSRGIKSVSPDGCICLSSAERSVEDWLIRHEIPHEKEPFYPKHPEFNPQGLRRADWKVEDIYIEYFGLEGNQEYDMRTDEKLIMANHLGIDLIAVYPSDLGELGSILGRLDQ